VLGLTLVFLVASFSAGGLTYWVTRSQQLQERVSEARLITEGVARLVGTALLPDQPSHALHRLVGELSSGPLIRELAVTDSSGKLLAGPSPSPEAAHQMQRALASGLQQISLVEQPSPRLLVVSPLVVDGVRRGAILFESPLGLGGSWPRLFWVLVVFDTVLIVAFMALVLTRYVVSPLRAMQQAALRVAGGDLQVRLQSSGAMELASLADSFNRMTVSVQEQLDRLEHQQRELSAQRAHLIRSEKLASVGRLAAGVAHEVGNPLQAIIGFTDMVLGGGLDPEQSRDFLERTRAEAQRIHRIIRDLLDFARPVEDAIEPVELAAVVEQSLQLCGPQQRLKEVTVERSGLDELPRVAASGARLVQVLVNILLNAADAMQAHGTIFVAGRPDDGGGRVELRIANTGPPIPAEHRGRIFDPFFTTKEPGHGTGLGLSVAQSIVESYGGRLMLLDEPRTTFALLLQPWQEGAAARAEEK
jgi:signal transduction histidine kinase